MQHVLIIGGGLYGCSSAYYLLTREPGMRGPVIKRDAGYTHAGVRILFSQGQSIEMSRHGHEFYARFAEQNGCRASDRFRSVASWPEHGPNSRLGTSPNFKQTGSPSA